MVGCKQGIGWYAQPVPTTACALGCCSRCCHCTYPELQYVAELLLACWLLRKGGTPICALPVLQAHIDETDSKGNTALILASKHGWVGGASRALPSNGLGVKADRQRHYTKACCRLCCFVAFSPIRSRLSSICSATSDLLLSELALSLCTRVQECGVCAAVAGGHGKSATRQLTRGHSPSPGCPCVSSCIHTEHELHGCSGQSLQFSKA